MTQEASAVPPVRPSGSIRIRRADARRNIAAIVDAARRTLAADPRAAMQDIAREAGLHRATLHRHFPTRDDLVDAVRHAAVEEAGIALDTVLADAEGRSLGQTLTRLTTAMIEVGDRFRLYGYTNWQSAADDEQRDRNGAKLLALFERARAVGELRTDVPVDQLLVAYGGLIWSALPEIADGRMTHADALAFVRTMMVPPVS